MTRLALLTLLVLLVLPADASRHKRHRSSKANRRPSGNVSLSGSSLGQLLTAEDHRFTKDRAILSALTSSSPKLQEAALLALGRIGDTSGLETIARILGRKDREPKKTAIFALSVMGDDTAYKILTQNLPMQRDPEIVGAILTGVGRAGNSEPTVSLLAGWLKEDSSALVLEGATHGLGILWAGNSDKWQVPAGLLSKLAHLAQTPDPVATSAAFALARFKGDPAILPVTELLEAADKTPSVPARAFLCRTLGRAKTPAAMQYLSQIFQPSQPLSIRSEVARALGNLLPSEAVLEALKRGLSDPSAAVVESTLESIGSLGAAALNLSDPVDVIFNTSASIWARGAALKALARINPVLGRQRLTPLLALPSSPLFVPAIGALAALATQEDLTKLAELVNNPDPRVAEEALEAFGSFSEDRITPPMKAQFRRALEKGDAALSSLVAQMVERWKWKDFAPSLAAVYDLFTSPDQLEGKTAILNALAAVGDHTSVPVLEKAMNDSDKLVVMAASNAIKAITGRDESARIPLNSRVNAPKVNMQEVSSALRAEVILKTSRGEIQMKMLEAAPLTATNFVRLVKKGFYDGKTFHRVVPDFVTQGGDPRGDGYGGPGYFIRDEVSPLKHDRGTVGIATSGKDTGGSQFFFNLAPNLHLDGRYTLFAQVTKGMDVVDQLEIGDRILTARVR